MIMVINANNDNDDINDEMMMADKWNNVEKAKQEQENEVVSEYEKYRIEQLKR